MSDVNGDGASPEILERAKLYGWKEDYQGDNPIDAETFVRRAEERLDIAKGTIRTVEKTNAVLMKSNKDLADKLERMEITFKQFVEGSRKAEERAYQRAKAELEQQLDQAVEDGDKDTHRKVLDELKDLDSQIAARPAVTGVDKPSGAGQVDQSEWSQEVFDGWLEENGWHDEEPDMAIYAESVDRALARGRTTRNQSQADRLAAITKLVEKKFPAYFGHDQGGQDNGEKEVRSGRRSSVEGSGSVSAGRTGGGKKTYADLPPDAKQVCDELVSDGILKREDYVNTYQW
jgi:hypothetical protein